MSLLTALREKRHIIRLWSRPSFDNPTTWLIYADVRPFGEYRNPIVLRVPFEAEPIDFFARPSTPWGSLIVEGKVQIDELYLKPDEFKHLDLLRTFTLPLAPKVTVLGMDGTFYGYQSYLHPFASATLEWWEDQPESWHELIGWAKQTRDYLDQLFVEQERAYKDINQLHSPDTKIWRDAEHQD